MVRASSHAEWASLLQGSHQTGMRDLDDLDIRASAAIETYLLPWLDTPDTAHVVMIASERVLHRILQTLMALHGKTLSSLQDPGMRTLAVHTARLVPGSYHQLLIGSQGGAESPCDVRVITLNETGHLSQAWPAPLPLSPISGTGSVLSPSSSEPSSPAVALPPVTLSSLSRSTVSSPLRSSDTPRPDAGARPQMYPTYTSSSPSPSRGRAGGSLISLPLGTRTTTTTPHAPRNIHLYDMSTMVRSMDKWDSVRSLSDPAANDSSDTIHSPLTTTRALDSGSIVRPNSTFPGGAMLGLGNLRSSDSYSTTSFGSPTQNYRASLPGPPSSTTLGVHTQASSGTPTLSNVSAFAQSLFGHHPSSGPSGTGGSDAMTIWQGLCVRLLPLFNGEALHTPIETMSDSADTFVHLLFERDPAQALPTLEDNVRRLANTGLLSVTNKLQGLEGMFLLQGLVKAWQSYYANVLPYIQACLFPLESSAAHLAYLDRIAQQSRRGTPADTNDPVAPSKGVQLRRILLVAFRDRVVLPIGEWLLSALESMDADPSPFFPRTRTAGNISKQLRPYLIQLMGMLTSLHTDDVAQQRTEKLRKSLTYSPAFSSGAESDSFLSPTLPRSLLPPATFSSRSSNLASPAAAESLV